MIAFLFLGCGYGSVCLLTAFFDNFQKNMKKSREKFCPILDTLVSGSPIIQDGKLVGAVTHVLVNDPTTGYGIFIENMLDAAA